MQATHKANQSNFNRQYLPRVQSQMANQPMAIHEREKERERERESERVDGAEAIAYQLQFAKKTCAYIFIFGVVVTFLAHGLAQSTKSNRSLISSDKFTYVYAVMKGTTAEIEARIGSAMLETSGTFELDNVKPAIQQIMMTKEAAGRAKRVQGGGEWHVVQIKLTKELSLNSLKTLTSDLYTKPKGLLFESYQFADPKVAPYVPYQQ